MPRHVRILPRVRADLRRIGDSIRDRVSDASAKRWSDKLRAAVADLADTAEVYP